MYLQHYKLIEKPFQISPDPRFLWLGEKHKEAFANLLYSMIDQNGFLVLTGDVGSGKTTLLNALLENIGSDVLAATISNPRMDPLEMLRYIARAFDPDVRCEDKTEFIFHMNRRFREIESQGKKLLLVIDEAHLLSDDQLEEIRLISNIESSQKKLITIILIGQNELNEKLSSDACRALRQRITLYYQLQPFTLEETTLYINHRLLIAGTSESVFTTGAVDEIQKLSGGLPRLINVLCARSLLTGFAKEIQRIDRDVVRECGQELHLGERISPAVQSVPSSDLTGFHQALSAAQAQRVQAAPSFTPPEQPTPLARPWHRRIAFSPAALAALLIPALAFFGVFILMHKPVTETGSVEMSIAPGPVEPAGDIKAAPASVEGRADVSPKAGATGAADKEKRAGEALNRSLSGPNKIEHAASGNARGSKGILEQADREKETVVQRTPAPKTAELPRPPSPSPDTGPAVQVVARNALEKQNYRYAIEVVESYLAGQPEAPAGLKQIYVQALTEQGRLHLEANRYKEAEADLRKAVSNAPEDFQAHFELGKLYTRTQEYAKAVESYKHAIAAKPDSAAGMYNLGFVYAGQKDWDNAEKMLLRAADQKSPFIDKIYFNLGVVQLKLGKKNDGIHNLKKSLGINPENMRARQYLAQLGEAPR